MVKHGALMHEAGDDVAVAIINISRGVVVEVMTLEGEKIGEVEAIDDIPLGHKISMRDIVEGEEVIKYGRPIGRATRAIARGAHIHVHNIMSTRWGR